MAPPITNYNYDKKQFIDQYFKQTCQSNPDLPKSTIYSLLAKIFDNSNK